YRSTKMDSYDFSRETGRPVSPPLPEDYSMDYLPQMATYSGSTQSRNTSVSQPIDFGGSTSRYTGTTQSRGTSVPQIEYGGNTSRYTGATQSRGTSVPQIEYGGSTSRYTGATQSRRTNVQQIGYGSVSQSGGATGSSASQRTSTRIGVPIYTDEEKSQAISGWRESGLSQKDYASSIGVPQSTFHVWTRQASSSNTESAEEKWSRRVSEWRASGLSQRAFSKREGLSRSALNDWIQKLG
ncbi:MAG: transposase, partial [Exilibacterium sp.]